jgi:hypothetical protein
MTQFAVSALIARRREIMGEKAYLEKEIERCDEAMSHIDATIRLFDPEFDFSRIKPRRHLNEDEFFQPGEIPVLALEVLREAGRPLATNAVTTAILKRRGIFDLVGKVHWQRLNAKVNAALNAKFRQRLVVKAGGGAPGESRSVSWSLMTREHRIRLASANSPSIGVTSGE